MTLLILIFFIVIFFIVLLNKNNNKIAVAPKPVIGNGNLDLIITNVNKNYSINALQEIRLITGYDLYRTKMIIDNVPFRLFANIDNESAQEIKERLEKCGVSVDITNAEGVA